jgi:CHASE2 domain-containing sensor protein
MKRFWNWDAGLGLVLTLAAVVSAALAVPFTESLENKLYDLRVRSAKIPPPSDDIRLVAIDAPSLEAIGRWRPSEYRRTGEGSWRFGHGGHTVCFPTIP